MTVRRTTRRAVPGAFLIALCTAPPQPADAQERTGPAAGYDEGFFIESADGNHRLVVGARAQARYAFETRQGAPDQSRFSIPSARLQLTGHTLTEVLTYAFGADFGEGRVSLADLYVDYALVPKACHLRAGQWKMPFSRQRITSAGRLQFVDRAVTDEAFGAGRDVGIAIHDDYEASPRIEYALGLFNGTGEAGVLSGEVMTDPASGAGEITSGAFSNVPDVFNPTLVARVGYNDGGLDGYSESDFDGGPLRLGIAASGLADFEADRDDDSSVRAEIDYVAKVQHFSSTGGIYLWSHQTGPEFSDRAVKAIGGYAQIAYLIGNLVEPGFRYEAIEPDGSNNTDHLLTLALSVYPFEHEFKWQTDGTAMLPNAREGGAPDYRLRSQLQLAF